MRAIRPLTVTALVALPLLLPLPATAQTPLRPGQTFTGRLALSDPKFADSSHYRMYEFDGTQGDTVTLELASDDFDAMLVLTDASGNSLDRDDDGGERCNSRLVYAPRQTGKYRVYANSNQPFELGEYRISLSRGARPAPADTVCNDFGMIAGRVQIGQSITKSLTTSDRLATTDSTYYQRWVLPVTANVTFTVDLESSDFDAYLILTNGRGEKLVENDDGGGGCNSRLVHTSTTDHPLRLIVNTQARPPRQTGRFTLRVSRGALPTEPKGNCRLTPAPTAGGGSAPRPTPAGGLAIRVGETANGSLTSADSLYPDNTYFKVYQFTATPRRPITIDLASDDFDPVLIIRGDDLAESVINHDGGPGCASRVSQTFLTSGPYRILVNTTSSPERQTGRFTLSVTDGSKPVQERGNTDCRAPTAAGGGGRGGAAPAPRRGTPTGGGRGVGGEDGARRSIAVGQTRQGALSTSDVLVRSDSTYAQAWTIQARAGQAVTIDIESDAFDAYLILRGPGISGGRDFWDDDSGGNCNARLTTTFPQDGEYEIVVNSTGAKYATGPFSLSVTSGSKPKSVARCSRSQ